jgi:hypothetical protein
MIRRVGAASQQEFSTPGVKQAGSEKGRSRTSPRSLVLHAPSKGCGLRANISLLTCPISTLNKAPLSSCARS